MAWRNVFCVVTEDLVALAKDRQDNFMIDKIPLVQVQAILFDGQLMNDEKKSQGRWATKQKQQKPSQSPSDQASDAGKHLSCQPFWSRVSCY